MKTQIITSDDARRIMNRMFAINDELQELDEALEHTPAQLKRIELLEEEYSELEQERRELPRAPVHHDLAVDEKEQ